MVCTVSILGKLTENGSFLACTVGGLEYTADSGFMLRTARYNTHLLGQIKRANQKHIHAVNPCNGIGILNALPRLNLDCNDKCLLCTLIIGWIARGHARNGVDSKDGSIAACTPGRILAEPDNACGVFGRVAHGSQHAVGTRVQGSLDHPLFGPGHTDDWTGALGGNGVDELTVLAELREGRNELANVATS